MPGARVVASDLPGRGRSEWLASDAEYSDPLYRSAMATLIARLDVADVDRIGTSLGGHIRHHGGGRDADFPFGDAGATRPAAARKTAHGSPDRSAAA